MFFLGQQHPAPCENSSVNMGFLSQQHPVLLHPAPYKIRGACLGKYRGRNYEKNGNGLSSMILDDEYFAIFFIRTLGVKGYYDVIVRKTVLESFVICRI